MIMEPLIAGFIGGWEIVIILAVVCMMALVAVVSLVVIAVVLAKKEPANKPAPSGNQPPPLRS